MAFDPNKITRENIFQAIDNIKSKNIELTPSTKWNVIIEGEQYPAKEIMRYAHEQMNGEKIWEYTGGENTNRFFRQLGLEVREKSLSNDPLKDIIEKYKAHISKNKLENETYKWQLINKFKGRPDVNTENFAEELISIDYANLIYPVGVSVIRHIAKEKTEEYRNCFRILFDETKDIKERIIEFSENTLVLYRQLVPEEKFSHHHDERTIATFLAFYNPDKYPLYKDSFYKKYCNLLGIKPKKKGEKYVHYIELIEDFIQEYIHQDSTLLQTITSLLPDDAYGDPFHKILAQDILYQMLDKQVSNTISYWRIGTSDSETSYWDSMVSAKVIAIGWSDLGNLNELNIKDRNDIYQLLKDAGYTYPNNITSKKAGEIYSFYSNIKVGDVVLAQDGARVLAIGIVEDEYMFIATDSFSHQRSVNWKIFNPNILNSEGLQTTVTKLTDSTLINKIDDILSGIQIDSYKNHLFGNPMFNQILFGPPGTGKTYHTIDIAVKIAAPEEYIVDDHHHNKGVFDRLLEKGRVVFTTFHQSMSYEDFVEGIKPLKPDSSNTVEYDIEPGLFKRISSEAKSNYENSKIENTDKLPFEVVFERLQNEWEETPDMKFSLKSEGYDFTITEFTPSLIRFRKASGGTGHNLNINTLRGIYYNSKNLNDGIRRYYDSVINRLLSYEKTPKINTKLSHYVLIIDEINRGNVSQIFGELITLIEADKRIGGNEAIEVTLPYSKEKFGVPPNLYIIGTMNTADRSVEALDTALRRRFSFIEMPPVYDLIELNNIFDSEIGLSCGELLQIINNRIEKLLNKDHLIGHSYFLGVDEWEGLQAVFQHNIIPLLQEYFFGDYGKIGLILGSGFFDNSGKPMTNVEFAKFDNYNGGDFDQREIYRLKDVSKMDEKTFTDAIKTLLNRKIEQE
jgi:hypothetical protein